METGTVEQGKPFEYKGLEDAISTTFEKPVDFRHDPFIRLAMRAGVVLVLVQLGVLVFNLKSLPKEVPLFYSLPWGEKRLADFRFLSILPAFSFAIVLLNFLIARRLYDTERLLARIISSVAFVSTVLCFITLFEIIFVIT